MPPVPPGVAGGALDGPPPPSGGPTGPTPGPDGGSPVSGPGGPPGAGAATGGDPNAARRAVTVMGGEIDKAMVGVAQAISQLGGQEGLQEIAQARQLFESGIAKFLAKGGAAPAISPTESGGGNFPGGGLNSGAI